MPDASQWQGLREAAAQLSGCESGLFAYAKALLLWQTRARFCGACGQPTLLRRAGHSARCTSADCGLEVFPRLDAAIIVLVEHEGRCLLGLQGRVDEQEACPGPWPPQEGGQDQVGSPGETLKPARCASRR